MAFRTSKQIKKDLKQLYKYHAEVLRRKPDYIKTYNEWLALEKNIRNDDDLNYFAVFQDSKGDIIKSGKSCSVEKVEKWIHKDRRPVLKLEPLTEIEKLKLRERRFKLEWAIWEKYNIHPPMDPTDTHFSDFVYYTVVFPSPDPSYFDFIKKCEKEPGGLLGVMKNRPEEFLKYKLKNNRFFKIDIDLHRDITVIKHEVGEIIKDIQKKMKQYGLLKLLDESPILDKFPLRDNRFLIVQVDMYRDKKVIINYVRELINEMKESIKNWGLLKRVDQRPNLDNSERYFKVYDLRNQKPPVMYSKIALKLFNYYPLTRSKVESLDSIINNCKKDYAVIFEEIHGIAYEPEAGKRIRRENLECFPCNNCKEKTCYGKFNKKPYTKPCEKLSYFLKTQNIETARKEVLFEKGVTDIIHSKDLPKGRKKSKRSDDEENPETDEKSYENDKTKVDRDILAWLRGETP